MAKRDFPRKPYPVDEPSYAAPQIDEIKMEDEEVCEECVIDLDPVSDDIEDSVELTPGVVTDCRKLNVRAEPKADAEVICVLDCLTEVMVDLINSTTGFYKICLVSGIEGYCVNKFIALQQ